MGNLTTAVTARRNSRSEEGDSRQFENVDLTAMDRDVRPAIITLSRVIMLVAAVGLVSLLGYGYVRFALQSTLSVASDRLTLSTVRPGLFHDYIPVTGNVVPRKSVFLDAIDGGQIIDIYVEEGAMVEAGEVLVKLKNTALQLEVISREAQLAEQINNLSVTQLSFEQNRLGHKRSLIDINYRIDTLGRQLERYRPLMINGGATQEQLDDIEAEHQYQIALRDAVAESQHIDELAQGKQIDTLQITVDSLDKNISIARDNLQNLTLRAPISGQLTSLEAEIGESKARGQRIGKIDEINSFRVSAFIDEFYLSRVRIGQSASTEIDQTDHSLSISKVYPEVRNRQFEVDLLFNSENKEPAVTIRRGQTLRLRLEIGDTTPALTLSNGTFFDDSGGLWVYILDADQNTAVRREVRLGRRNPDNIEVLGGLSEGDIVITSTYANFGEANKLLLN